jgi:hypothetical protein
MCEGNGSINNLLYFPEVYEVNEVEEVQGYSRAKGNTAFFNKRLA